MPPIIWQLYVILPFVAWAVMPQIIQRKITYKCHIISAMTAHATNSKIIYNCCIISAGSCMLFYCL
jgi:hypothetical protein